MAHNNVIREVKAGSRADQDHESEGGGVAVPRGRSRPGWRRQYEPVHVDPTDYVGSSADRTGFAGLEAVDEVTMLCVPDLLAAFERGMIDAEGFKAVQLAMIAHCELMSDRVAILDTPPGLNAQQVKEWRVDHAGYDSKYATLYWPRIKVMDPIQGKAIFVPPSGHVAGNDDRGVHRRPATGHRSAPPARITGGRRSAEPGRVNCIGAFAGQGIHVWAPHASGVRWRYQTSAGSSL